MEFFHVPEAQVSFGRLEICISVSPWCPAPGPFEQERMGQGAALPQMTLAGY